MHSSLVLETALVALSMLCLVNAAPGQKVNRGPNPPLPTPIAVWGGYTNEDAVNELPVRNTTVDTNDSSVLNETFSVLNSSALPVNDRCAANFDTYLFYRSAFANSAPTAFIASDNTTTLGRLNDQRQDFDIPIDIYPNKPHVWLELIGYIDTSLDLHAELWLHIAALSWKLRAFDGNLHDGITIEVGGKVVALDAYIYMVKEGTDDHVIFESCGHINTWVFHKKFHVKKDLFHFHDGTQVPVRWQTGQTLANVPVRTTSGRQPLATPLKEEFAVAK